MVGTILAAQYPTDDGDHPFTEVVPILGSATISASPAIEQLTETELLDLVVVDAILYRPQEDGSIKGINPPAGIWGDPNLAQSIATAIEEIDGIYAVRSLDLIDGRTGEAFDSSSVRPWQLFEIQDGFTVSIA